MRTSIDHATRLGVEALHIAGVPRAAASTQVALLIDAEMRGHPSHGLMRLPRLVARIANGVLNPTASGQHAWVSNSFLDVDGEDGLGPVVAVRALDEISRRARVTGAAATAISSSNHLGMLGWYVHRVASSGQVAIGFTTSEALMHPWGGCEAMVGSNPIAIAVPATPEPLVLDMATSAVSMGKIHHYADRGMDLASGWARDAAGRATLDPQLAMHGSIAPFGGPKGYGLGIAIEVLVASLTGSQLGRDVVGTLDDSKRVTKGDVFIVVQPPARREAFVGAYLEQVRNSRREDSEQPVLIPGDRSRMRRAESAGEIDIPDSLHAELCRLGGVTTDGAASRGVVQR